MRVRQMKKFADDFDVFGVEIRDKLDNMEEEVEDQSSDPVHSPRRNVDLDELLHQELSGDGVSGRDCEVLNWLRRVKSVGDVLGL